MLPRAASAAAAADIVVIIVCVETAPECVLGFSSAAGCDAAPVCAVLWPPLLGALRPLSAATPLLLYSSDVGKYT